MRSNTAPASEGCEAAELTGRITHLLMQARELTEGKPELDVVRHFIDAAIKALRKIHHRRG